jgi:hypothetical protein
MCAARAPSTSSSAASTLSVRFGGETMTLEEAIKKSVADIQNMFNQLEMQLVLLAAAQDQSIDDEADFRMCVEMEEKCQDIVDGMQYLLGELPDIAAEIRSDPPSKEARAWWTARKKERAAAFAALNAKRKEAAAAEKVARKALTAQTKAEGKE